MSWKKTRHDKYYTLAKEQGFRSRAAFKLIQMNQKFDFLSKARSCLDLCAAPGGWLQVAKKYMPTSSLILGVDILPIRPIRGVVCLKQDIRTVQCRTAIKRECQGWDFDVVIHDGAPNVGGSTWAKDAYGQAELVIHSLKLATEFLKPGGTFVTKIFRSQDYNALLWVLKKFFKEVTITKPASSRNASAEIFGVCQGFLAPKKVDPRLLDPAHVFKEVDASGAAEGPDVFHQKKERRNREGYEDGVTLLYKELQALEFINSDSPVELLGKYNAFTFKGDSDKLKGYTETSEEVLACCEDLRVLGKKDFSALLKWRLKLRKRMEEEKKEKEKAKRALTGETEDDAEADAEKKQALTEEERLEREKAKIEREVAMMHEKLLKREKKQKRRRREQMLRTRERIKSTKDLLDDDVDDGLDEDLFNLSAIKDSKVLEGVAGGKLHAEAKDGEFEGYDEDEDPLDGGEAAGSQSEDEELSDTEKRYIRMMGDMDHAYEEYRKRRDIPVRKRGRSSSSKLQLDPEEMVPGEEEFNVLADTRAHFSGDESGGDKAKENPLLVPIAKDEELEEEKKDLETGRMSRWFSRGLFEEDEEEEEEEGEEMETKKARNVREAAKKKVTRANGGDMEGDDGDDADEDIEEDEREAKRGADPKRKRRKMPSGSSARTKENKSKSNTDSANAYQEKSDSGFTLAGITTSFTNGGSFGTGVLANGGDNGGEDFEEVPIEDDWSSDSDARAEALAMGKLMIRKRTREKLINDSYNRYAFNDTEDAPQWFKNEETEYNVRILPVTREEVQEARQQLMAINAKPMKKVAEARYRKKVLAMKKMKKATQKAEGILNDESVPDGEKIKGIEKLIKKAAKRKKKDRVYVVSKRGPGGKEQTRAAIKAAKKKGGRVKLVDRRMRADTYRAKQRAKKGGGKGKKRKR